MAVWDAPEYEYDIALSFAGEQRYYVEQVAEELRSRGIRPFYDAYETATLWGKDLYEHLDYVYRRAARYCIVFASEEYAEKVWSVHERRSAQARAIEGHEEYILPARFDNTEIPGIKPTVAYVDLSESSPAYLADLVEQKLGPRPRSNFYPPLPDRLFQEMEVDGPPETDYVDTIARLFLRALRRMSDVERRVIFKLFLEGCVSELPENTHVSLDVIRRDLGIPPVELWEIIQGVATLGFDVTSRESSDDHSEQDMVEVKWFDLTQYEDSEQEEFSMDFSTQIAFEMIHTAVEGYCRDCGLQALLALDFSGLSSVTGDAGERETHVT